MSHISGWTIPLTLAAICLFWLPSSLSPSLSFSFIYLFIFLPDVVANEQLNDSSAGREGASDAICEREGGGAVVSAAVCAGATVVTSAGAREEQQGAGRAAGQTAGEGQSGQQSPAQQTCLHCVVFSSVSLRKSTPAHE